ncbi:MAG: C4-dicarboxylate TRAP transporter substrate-binding protein [Gammaproteobacteria bacterium]|nr:C4-dicarboxylate TRAP transporter substrate-binding protein [Gammaproteobacteria bacterium]
MNIIKSGLALAVTIFSTAVIADSYNVTMVAGHPPVFRWVKQMDDPFAPTVAAELEKLGHTINFTSQYGGSIAGVGEELETVEAGLAEIGACSSLFDPAKMPEQNVTYYTPFVSDDPRAVSELLHKLHEDPRMRRSYDENNVVYIGAPIAIDDYLLMTKFPLNSLDDLKGRKIAAPGPAINWLSGTGAVAVSGNLTTYYNELKTGVYDGVIVFASAALPGKLYEVAPHITKMGLGAQFAGAICANRDWYDGLPDDVQKALHTGADTALDWYLGDLENMVTTAFKVMGDNGATITDANDNMRNTWASGMENAAKTWAEDLDKKGRPGSEILTLYMDAMRNTGATPLRDWDKE